MAHWFTSRIKAAEQFLNTIDQQAAISLKAKEEKGTGAGSDAGSSRRSQKAQSESKRQFETGNLPVWKNASKAPSLPKSIPSSLQSEPASKTSSPLLGATKQAKRSPEDASSSPPVRRSLSGTTSYEVDDWTTLLSSDTPGGSNSKAEPATPWPSASASLKRSPAPKESRLERRNSASFTPSSVKKGEPMVVQGSTSQAGGAKKLNFDATGRAPATSFPQPSAALNIANPTLKKTSEDTELANVMPKALEEPMEEARSAPGNSTEADNKVVKSQPIQGSSEGVSITDIPHATPGVRESAAQGEVVESFSSADSIPTEANEAEGDAQNNPLSLGTGPQQPPTDEQGSLSLAEGDVKSEPEDNDEGAIDEHSGEVTEEDRAEVEDTETDSDETGSSLDTDEEEAVKKEAQEREARRQKEVAAAAALEATAVEAAAAAVKEQEELAAALAEEKEALQRAAAEVAEKHAKELAALRVSVMEGARAMTTERHLHSSTRIDLLSREEQLQAENGEQAKALASAQRALDDLVQRVLQLREHVEEAELARSGFQVRLGHIQERIQHADRPAAQGSAPAPPPESHSAREKASELGRLLEARQQKVVELEAQLASASQRRQPSVMERELEHRLEALTDHLIHKQAQVEALSSEKATLSLRLETLTNALQEERGLGAANARTILGTTKRNKITSAEDDLEFGTSTTSYSSTRSGKLSVFGTREHSLSRVDVDSDDLSHEWLRGRRLPGVVAGVLQKVDAWTLGGGGYLRAHGTARALLATYLFALHGWVVLVWLMHTKDGPVETPGLSLPGTAGVVGLP